MAPETLRITTSGPHSFVVEAGAKKSVVLSLEDATELSCSLQIQLGAEAVCDVTVLQMLPSATVATITQEITVGEGAHLHLRNIELGGKKITHTVRSTVAGAHGRSDIDWLMYGKGEEALELSARNIFMAREGRGEIVMKGIAEEKAHAKVHGFIDIGLQGNGTDTYLTQSVLMLDPTAKIDAIPGLEIKTNDVKASHSATVQRVTPEDLFTFASRGIEKHEARKMFVLGFASSLLESIEDEELREKIVGLLEEKYVN